MLCFSPWFAQPLKLNLRTNRKYREKNTTNINATVLTVGCCYALRKALVEQQSICERSFVRAVFIFFFTRQFSCLGCLLIH